MNKLKEFAEKLNGRQYLNELTKELETYAKENGIVVVFGQSDDLMEVRGAIDEEFGCYDGGIFYLGFAKVEAIWCPKGTDYSWGYKTDFPHETFTIMEDNEHYCKGIVFYLKDLKPKRTNYDKITASADALAEFLSNHIEHYMFRDVAQIQANSIDNKTGRGLTWQQAFKEWLQKECDNG